MQQCDAYITSVEMLMHIMPINCQMDGEGLLKLAMKK
jgi:hypothetical protein